MLRNTRTFVMPSNNVTVSGSFGQNVTHTMNIGDSNGRLYGFSNGWFGDLILALLTHTRPITSTYLSNLARLMRLASLFSYVSSREKRC